MPILQPDYRQLSVTQLKLHRTDLTRFAERAIETGKDAIFNEIAEKLELIADILYEKDIALRDD